MNKRRDCEERFRERYAQPTTEAALIVERDAICANVGANGFTTLRQADLLADRLGLGPAQRLLDIGWRARVAGDLPGAQEWLLGGARQ